MTDIIFLIIALFTVTAALYAMLTKDRTVSVLSAGAAGLFASILFLMMAAPDVAMTEAAIGSGLTTFIFFFALRKIRSSRNG
ncbi:MAG: DUF4040 domain-containing protein [Spirochaetales bacterium]|nr:DUF4040 domain-containing protein [Spirochaetales bacterium]